ncbi:MAG: ATP-binding protein [Chloroflexota bacterium]
MAKTYRKRVTSSYDQLAGVSDFVGQVCSDLKLDEWSTYAVRMAVDEACTNVIKYAYDERADGTILLFCCQKNDELVVTIRDHGRAFDPQAVPPPDLTGELLSRKEGGLGMFLMRQLMDRVSYRFHRTKGNVLTMTKRLRR